MNKAKTMITDKCNHEPNEDTFQIAEGYSTERECVVNVCCKHCGKCGSMAFDLHNATFDDGMMVVADEDRDETEKKTVTLIEKQNWTPETLERLYSDFIDVQDLHSRLLGFLEEIARLENEQSKEDWQENKPEAEENEEEGVNNMAIIRGYRTYLIDGEYRKASSAWDAYVGNQSVREFLANSHPLAGREAVEAYVCDAANTDTDALSYDSLKNLENALLEFIEANSTATRSTRSK